MGGSEYCPVVHVFIMYSLHYTLSSDKLAATRIILKLWHPVTSSKWNNNINQTLQATKPWPLHLTFIRTLFCTLDFTIANASVKLQSSMCAYVQQLQSELKYCRKGRMLEIMHQQAKP